MIQRPLIGVGVIILKDGKILLGKRRNAHGEGSWSFPGGHLEFGESIEECALREIEEETGITVTNLRKAGFTNDIFSEESKHYVTLFMVADYKEGEVTVREPDKCEKWEWFERGTFPEPLFLPIRNLIKGGYRFESVNAA